MRPESSMKKLIVLAEECDSKSERKRERREGEGRMENEIRF